MHMQLRTSKRGRICLAQSGSQCLVGEATIQDCFQIARRSHPDGQFQPCTSSKLNQSRFLLNPDNMQKHQVYDLTMLQSYTNVYARVLSNIMPYAQPVKYSPKPGAIVWAKLDHTSASRPNVVAAVICIGPHEISFHWPACPL